MLKTHNYEIPDLILSAISHLQEEYNPYQMTMYLYYKAQMCSSVALDVMSLDEDVIILKSHRIKETDRFFPIFRDCHVVSAGCFSVSFRTATKTS